MKKLIETYGKDTFVVEVRKTFTDQKSAVEWEHKVLRRLKVNQKPEWLNDIYYKCPNRKGTPVSEKQRMAGYNNFLGNTWFKGKTHSDDAKKAIGEKNRIAHQKNKDRYDEIYGNRLGIDIRVITPDGKTIVINNISKFCREHDLDKSHLIKVAKGKALTHKGYSCEYLN